MSILRSDSSPRRIPFQGSPNFRDFGGYPTAHGRSVRRNLLFRSGQLSALTTSDLQAFQSLNLEWIFDFRREQECLQEPTVFPSGVFPKIVSLPIEPGSTSHFNVMDGISSESLTSAEVIEFMCHVYREFVSHHSDKFRSMFEYLLNRTRGASLIHCSAGKDRTGFAAAMILSALGVPREAIVKDYLLSAEFFNAEAELPRHVKKFNWSGSVEVFRPLLEVREDYLLAAFTAVLKEYSDLDGYLAEELGVDEQAREELRARYLEA